MVRVKTTSRKRQESGRTGEGLHQVKPNLPTDANGNNSRRAKNAHKALNAANKRSALPRR